MSTYLSRVLPELQTRLTKLETNARRIANKPWSDEEKAVVSNAYGLEVTLVREMLTRLHQAEAIRATRRVATRAYDGGSPGESREVRALT
jgi:hypothetical protein